MGSVLFYFKANHNIMVTLFVALVTVSAIAVAVPEAEAHGYYYPYYHGHGTLLSPPSIANIDYGKTKIKYNVKRSADPEPYGYFGYGYPYYHLHGYKPYKPASIANIDYGKTGIKYLRKRSADPVIRREAESEAGPIAGPGPMDMEAGPKAGPHLKLTHPHITVITVDTMDIILTNIDMAIILS